MIKKLFIIFLLFFPFNSICQNIIYWENCEITGFTWRATFSNSNAVYISGLSTINDSPANTQFYNSFDRSIALYGSGNAGSGPERVILNLPTVNLNPNIAHCLKVKIASFGIGYLNNTAAGVDNQDYLRLSVAYNGSNIYSPEIQVNGSNNNIWTYNAPSTVYRTVQGSYSNYSQVLGQEYSTLILELPVGTSQISAEIDMSCNSSGESWFVDDIQIISNCYSPLPIELLSFTGNLIESKVELSWNTASEVNNDYFTIYALDSFNNTVFVSNVKGSGNSNSIKQYSFTDYDPKNYYKLCQTDYDGQSECFDWIYVNIPKKPSKIFKIYDIYGRVTNLKFNEFLICIDENGIPYKIFLNN